MVGTEWLYLLRFHQFYQRLSGTTLGKPKQYFQWWQKVVSLKKFQPGELQNSWVSHDISPSCKQTRGNKDFKLVIRNRLNDENHERLDLRPLPQLPRGDRNHTTCAKMWTPIYARRLWKRNTVSVIYPRTTGHWTLPIKSLMNYVIVKVQNPRE